MASTGALSCSADEPISIVPGRIASVFKLHASFTILSNGSATFRLASPDRSRPYSLWSPRHGWPFPYPPGIHAGRAARGDCDYWRAGGVAVACGSIGPRSSPPFAVCEQPEADGAGNAQLPRHLDEAAQRPDGGIYDPPR